MRDDMVLVSRNQERRLQPSLSRRRVAASFGAGAKGGEQCACGAEKAENDRGILRRIVAAGLSVKGYRHQKKKRRPDEKPH
jgi:hypothetical protein